MCVISSIFDRPEHILCDYRVYAICLLAISKAYIVDRVISKFRLKCIAYSINYNLLMHRDYICVSLTMRTVCTIRGVDIFGCEFSFSSVNIHTIRIIIGFVVFMNCSLTLRNCEWWTARDVRWKWDELRRAVPRHRSHAALKLYIHGNTSNAAQFYWLIHVVGVWRPNGPGLHLTIRHLWCWCGLYTNMV